MEKKMETDSGDIAACRSYNTSNFLKELHHQEQTLLHFIAHLGCSQQYRPAFWL